LRLEQGLKSPVCKKTSLKTQRAERRAVKGEHTRDCKEREEEKRKRKRRGHVLFFPFIHLPTTHTHTQTLLP
jgi:hypothetical protein